MTIWAVQQEYATGERPMFAVFHEADTAEEAVAKEADSRSGLTTPPRAYLVWEVPTARRFEAHTYLREA